MTCHWQVAKQCNSVTSCWSVAVRAGELLAVDFADQPPFCSTFPCEATWKLLAKPTGHEIRWCERAPELAVFESKPAIGEGLLRDIQDRTATLACHFLLLIKLTHRLDTEVLIAVAARLFFGDGKCVFLI
jgi:hypothetical protein